MSKHIGALPLKGSTQTKIKGYWNWNYFFYLIILYVLVQAHIKIYQFCIYKIVENSHKDT